jgi:hypothetical protein
MLVDITSTARRLLIPLDFGDTKQDRVPVPVPSGTASAMVNLDEKWIEIDASQAWFWADEWQARHKLAVSELESGDYLEFTNGDDFIASLDNLDE